MLLTLPRITRSALAIGAMAALVLATTLPAMADTATGTATVKAGTLTEATAATPSVTVTLDGTDQAPTYTLPITVTDATGSGAGWNLTVTSTQFSTGSGGNTLPTTASSVTGATSACAAGTCTNANNGISYPLTIPAAPVAPLAVKLFNAALTTGRGKVLVTPTVSVAIPGNTLAGTYSSVITLAAVSAP